MSSFYEIDEVRLLPGDPESACAIMRAIPSSVFDRCLAEAIALAASLPVTARVAGEIRYDFNGVEVRVRADSDPALIERDWRRGMSGYLGENAVVGPYPATELSPEEVARDAAVEAENAARRAAADEAYRKKQERDEATLRGALALAPPMALREAAAADWYKGVEANGDPYGAAVYRFAESWARLMQGRIERGQALEDCAGECASVAAAPIGLTGSQYGCAVGVLADCWEHGEALRRWHNLKTQIRDEGKRANESGGVLNPALLRVGKE